MQSLPEIEYILDLTAVFELKYHLVYALFVRVQKPAEFGQCHR